MSKTTTSKFDEVDEVGVIIGKIHKLQKKLRCSKEHAVLELIKTGDISGRYKLSDISRVFGIRPQRLEYLIDKTLYKMNKIALKLGIREELKDTLLDLESK